MYIVNNNSIHKVKHTVTVKYHLNIMMILIHHYIDELIIQNQFTSENLGKKTNIKTKLLFSIYIIVLYIPYKPFSQSSTLRCAITCNNPSLLLTPIMGICSPVAHKHKFIHKNLFILLLNQRASQAKDSTELTDLHIWCTLIVRSHTTVTRQLLSQVL